MKFFIFILFTYKKKLIFRLIEEFGFYLELFYKFLVYFYWDQYCLKKV
jgi:hypothetical protein